MLEEQGSKLHGTVSMQNDVHRLPRAAHLATIWMTGRVSPFTKYVYDKHVNYVPEPGCRSRTA